MRWNRFVPIAAALICGFAATAGAEDKASSSTIRASALTREQFKALSPDATIEINGEQISKREFTERRTNALERAISEMREMKAKAEAEFAAQRRAFLEAERAKLEEANKRVEVEIARLVAADAAAHGSNWEARKSEAAALLKEAATAPFNQRSQLEKRASDLLSSNTPQQ